MFGSIGINVNDSILILEQGNIRLADFSYYQLARYADPMTIQPQVPYVAPELYSAHLQGVPVTSVLSAIVC